MNEYFYKTAKAMREVKASEEYFQSQIEDHLYSHELESRVLKYADLRVKEAIEELADKDAVEYLKKNVCGISPLYVRHETAKYAISISEAKHRKELECMVKVEDALEAFKHVINKHALHNSVFLEYEWVERYSEEFKSKLSELKKEGKR